MAPCHWRASGEGTFDHWTVHAAREPEIESSWRRLDPGSIRGYTGILNFETIGGRMIEVHLRMSDQWPDLYGAGWVDAVVRLYHRHEWDFADADRRDGCSVPALRAARAALSPPPARRWSRGAADAGHVERADHLPRRQGAWQHAMPPGGFRLAVINATNLEAARLARRRL